MVEFDYELYSNIYQQNQTLKQNITELKEKYSTDEQLFNYTSTSWNFLIKLNGLFLLIYYILLIGLILILFVSKKNNLGLYPKIGLITFLGILPFIYLWIEIMIWEIIKYMWSLISGRIYYKDVEGRGNMNYKLFNPF